MWRQLKQESEEPIIKFLHWLREASRYCRFERLGKDKMPIEEELIQLKLIEGVDNTYHRLKISMSN